MTTSKKCKRCGGIVKHADWCPHCGHGSPAEKEKLETLEKVASQDAQLDMILSATYKALDGVPVSDFEESFPPVRKALDLIVERDALKAELEKARADNMCDACGGSGTPVSGRKCMCGGSGKMSDAAQYLRAELAAEHRMASGEMLVRKDLYDTVQKLRAELVEAEKNLEISEKIRFDMANEHDRISAELAEVRQKMHEAYEIYANSECGKPTNTSEAYTLRILQEVIAVIGSVDKNEGLK